VDIDFESGSLNKEQMIGYRNEKKKIVAFQHVSNVMACVNPVKEIVAQVRVKAPNAVVLLDACQSVPNLWVFNILVLTSSLPRDTKCASRRVLDFSGERKISLTVCLHPVEYVRKCSGMPIIHSKFFGLLLYCFCCENEKVGAVPVMIICVCMINLYQVDNEMVDLGITGC